MSPNAAPCAVARNSHLLLANTAFMTKKPGTDISRYPYQAFSRHSTRALHARLL